MAILIPLIFSTCEDRPRTNPLDPETELDPSKWTPSNLQVQVIDDSQIKLTWTQEDDRISGFRISRKAGSGSFAQIADIGKDTTVYTDTGLNYGTEYIYRVKAFSGKNESDYATSDTTGTIFPPPSGLAATPVSDSEIQLSWSDNCSFEVGFRISRSSGGSFSQIGAVDTNVTVYTDTGLKVWNNYVYRVKAFTDDNESGYATSSAINTTFPSPSNLTATAVDDQSIQLTWSHSCSFEDGYKLERSEDGVSFTQISVLGENVTEYTNTGLNFGTSYTYRVSAYTDNNESEYAT
ncbi:MAG: fibronectin type III domain-containing protein, partial [Candidatus Marinimicrobia bacterium]|nr:fibronectin type III domain-containing protein [Candidatus Neomarinimicrobiota bacterium]